MGDVTEAWKRRGFGTTYPRANGACGSDWVNGVRGMNGVSRNSDCLGLEDTTSRGVYDAIYSSLGSAAPVWLSAL